MKKIILKLSLNRETVRELDHGTLKQAQGAAEIISDKCSHICD